MTPIKINLCMLNLAAALWQCDRLKMLIGFRMLEGMSHARVESVFKKLEHVMPADLWQELGEFHTMLLNYRGEPFQIIFEHEETARTKAARDWTIILNGEPLNLL